MSATITTTTAVNGLKVLEAVGYDHQLFAVLIAHRNDWPEILDTIPSPNLRKNAAASVAKIRKALALEFGHAMDICQGRA